MMLIFEIAKLVFSRDPCVCAHPWLARALLAIACVAIAPEAEAATLAIDHGSESSCNQTTTLSRATRTLRNQLQPAEPSRTETLVLYDRLPRAQMGNGLYAHYRIDVTPCPVPRALFVSRTGAAYSLTIDGHDALALAPSEPSWTWRPAPPLQPHRHNPRVPALFHVPAGAKVIEIELEGLAFLDFGLSPLRIGPASELALRQAATYRAVGESMVIAALMTVILACLGVFIWLRRRREQGLKWLLAASVVWIVRAPYSLPALLPMPALYFESGITLLVAAMAHTVTMATLHILGRWSQRWNRVATLALAASVTLVVAGLADPVHAAVLRGASYSIAILSIFAMVVVTFGHVRKRPQWQSYVVAGGYLALLVGLLHDYLLVQGIWPDSDDAQSWLHWGYLALLLTFVVRLLDTALRAQERVEQINLELEALVKDRTEALTQSYVDRENQQMALAASLARQEERARLVREIHDGIGGQLTTTLRAIERGSFTPDRVSQTLQESLDDLRLVMDASSMHDRLDDALAAWRHRWDTRLELLGLELQWHVQDPLETPQLQAQDVLHLLRILQEAVTNALKHAHATQLQVHVRCDTLGLELRIRDNGQGWRQQPHNPAGHGMNSLRQRAKQLGANLDIESVEGQGTEVRLVKAWQTLG